ncbi:zinc finger CCCH domain-containing protein 53-like isoform X2 [Silene latifolia]|uniref:zinc finger CCCH domain-containing protein 53-like isoform X2 n=1 Tax=Silene latifolia TaxID=37657 RepID=UPI003D76A441
MESYEASRTVFTKVQTLDPENASKIMGYILLHHGEKDMIHLAYGPENLILSLVSRAKTELGLSSNTSSASLISPISNPIAISRPNPLKIPLSIPRLSPSSPSIWSPNHFSPSPNHLTHNPNSSLNYLDDGHFLNDNPSKNGEFTDPNDDSMVYPTSIWDSNNNNINSNNNGENNPNFLHRRSSSFNESLLSYYGTDESTCGFGFKPCLYYARGFCKNGSSCKFVHGGVHGGDDNYDAFEQCEEEIFRSKLAHQHRLAAAQLMANGVNLPYNKLNFLHSEAQRSAAALMMSEDFHKLNRIRMARNEFAGMDCNPGSRQIYLTFPADSSFKEEDVSNYFNKFGPVQDVRIPYQQKRMFGFVTFVFPETVKIILAKGNPHFVCDSRVLVKPYKEKGKLPDKKQHLHQLERGDFSCSSPSGHDCREPYDFQPGGRVMFSTQEMLLRKKLEEQADFQHALELQERRLMNLQLFDLKNHQHHGSIGSSTPSPNLSSQVSNGISLDLSEESSNGADDDLTAEGVNIGLNDSNEDVPKKEGNSPNRDENDFFESLDHVLPENLFASPTKSSSDIGPVSFSPAEPDNSASLTESLPATSSLTKTPLKSCFFETPRISNGHGALGM